MIEEKDWQQLKKAYKGFADAMRETKLGSLIIWIFERFDKLMGA